MWRSLTPSSQAKGNHSIAAFAPGVRLRPQFCALNRAVKADTRLVESKRIFPYFLRRQIKRPLCRVFIPFLFTPIPFVGSTLAGSNNMKYSLHTLLLATAFVASSLPTRAEIIIDYGRLRQRIDGFGGNVSLDNTTAFTVDSSGNPYGMANNDMIEDLADELFGPDKLNVTFLRVSNWWNYKEYYSAEKYHTRPEGVYQGGISYLHWFNGTKRAMQEFKERQGSRGGKIMMTAWSPAPYLKTDEKTIGGKLRKINGKFDYAGLAVWWKDSLAAYPIKPNFISIQNEPDFLPGKWEGMQMKPSFNDAINNRTMNMTDSKASADLPHYGTALDAIQYSVRPAYPNIKFIGPDTSHVGDDPNKPAWKVLSYTDNLAPASISDIGAIAHHLYQDNPHYKTEQLDKLRDEFPYEDQNKLAKYATEFNADKDNSDAVPDWMFQARTIHNVMVHESANAYLVWDLVNGFVEPYKVNNQFPREMRYYGLAHFSKYINPGDQRVSAMATDSTGIDEDVWVSAYRSDRGDLQDQLILVIINTGSKLKKHTIRCANFWDPIPSQRWLKIIRTTTSAYGSKRLAMDANIAQNGSLRGDYPIELAPYSLTTFIMN